MNGPGTARLSVLEVQRDRFDEVGAEFVPGVALGEDGMTSRAGVEAALLRIANVEDQFHRLRIPEGIRRVTVGAHGMKTQVSTRVSGTRQGDLSRFGDFVDRPRNPETPSPKPGTQRPSAIQ